MRVNIGPYVNRWTSNFHTNYMNKKYGFDWADNQSNFENFLEKLENMLQWVYNKTINVYLDKKERKIRIKLHRYDTFSMDDTLAHIIYPMLKDMQENKNGSPWVDDEDVPEELKSTSAPPKENDWDIDDNHFKRWEWVLTEMTWAFQQKTREWWEEDYISEYPEFDFSEKKSDGLYELKILNNGKRDDEGIKNHQKRMTNGFRLFGKYYESLWT